MVSTIEDTLKHAVFLAKHLNGCGIECAISVVLLELGISAKGAGFDYLVKSIIIFSSNPTQILTKEIYPAVGESYDPTASRYQVERLIRVAINDAWENRDPRMWRYYFSVDSAGDIRKPSNGEFISRIARFVQLWQGCCKGVSNGNE